MASAEREGDRKGGDRDAARLDAVAGNGVGADRAGASASPDAVADLIADELARLGGPARQRLADMLHQLGAIDRAVYAAVAAVPAPALDKSMRRLSDAANHSRLWLAIAAVLALTGP